MGRFESSVSVTQLLHPQVSGAQTVVYPDCAADILFYCCSVFFFLFSSPILSGCRLDVYYTSTHGVAVVRI